MWDRISLRGTTLRTGWVLPSMLLCAGAIATGAHGQTLPSTPSTDALPSGGVDVTTGPDGVKLGVDAGDTGGVTVGAGPGGVELDLRTTPKSAAPPAGQSPQSPGQRASAPGGATEGPQSGSPNRSTPGAGRDANRPSADTTGSDETRSAGATGGGDRSGGTPTVEDLRTAARTDRDRGGVAPVFDLIERIPAAVRAGLVALALIALAMWGLWVRGRRRLQHNAYVDPDTDVANMAAFEQVLDSEWQRASRYQRPLGLLLLEIEQRGAGGIPLLGERDAKDAADDIGQEVRQSDTVARLAPSRFAVICPEAPQGSGETLAHAIEHRLEERRLHCWASFSERTAADDRPADLVARAAAGLARAQNQPLADDPSERYASTEPALTAVGTRAA